jgi:subtilase family serine protease
MAKLINPADRTIPVLSIRGATAWHRYRTVLLAALGFLSLSSAPAVLAGVTIDLSPMVAKSTLISNLDRGQEISAVLSLPLSDPRGAADFVAQVSNPGNPVYGHYLTPKEFAARFGANQADYAAVENWAISNGLKISLESVARTTLTVSGSAAQFEALFQTHLNRYRAPDGQEFYSASVPPIIPDGIASKLVGVIGLTNSPHHAPPYNEGQILGEKLLHPDTPGGTGPNGYYAPADLQAAYNIPSFGGDVPQTIALYEECEFNISEIQTFLTKFGLPKPAITLVKVDFSKSNNATASEVRLDIDWLIAINPNVKEILAYTTSAPWPQGLIDVLERVVAADQAQTLSISFGEPEDYDGIGALETINTKLVQLAAEGITVCACAQDYGAYGPYGTKTYPATLHVIDPGSQPYVTCVGGTTLFTGPEQVWVGEQVWNNYTSKVGEDGRAPKVATGGGVSSFWPLPQWQPGSYVTSNGGSATYRNVPDVAALANGWTGVAIYNGKIWTNAGGTSLSSPLWASYLSILNSGLEYLFGLKIGFFNPALYSLDHGQPFNYLHDVVTGSNGNAALFGTPGYNAGPGYDNCSGSGSIAGAHFAFAFLTARSGGTPPGPINGLMVTPVKTGGFNLTWDAAVGATGYVIEVFPKDLLPGPAFAYVTKDTNQFVDRLRSTTVYTATVAAVNIGGSTQRSVNFRSN